MSDENLKNQCDDLEIMLRDGEQKDISAIELFDEIKNIKDFLKECDKSSLSILQYIYTNLLDSIFPNLIISLRILLTLPVSVASGERSFSKLKLIKNYLRSSMSQESVGLSMISNESDLCDKLDTIEIIDEFASLKARKCTI